MERGDHVIVIGLQHRTDLNRKAGVVQELLQNGRVCILMSASNETVSILPENLVRQEAISIEASRQRLLRSIDREHTCDKNNIQLGMVLTCAGCIADMADEQDYIQKRDTAPTRDAVNSQMKRPKRISCCRRDCKVRDNRSGNFVDVDIVYDPNLYKPLLRCSGCKRVHYCTLECQKSDWARHKLECRRLAGLHKVPDLSDIGVFEGASAGKLINLLKQISEYDITPGEQRGSFSDPLFKNGVREMGKSLNRAGGMNAMLKVHAGFYEHVKNDPIRCSDGKHLEYLWSGIGHWAP
jgi:hypothetical protein